MQLRHRRMLANSWPSFQEEPRFLQEEPRWPFVSIPQLCDAHEFLKPR
jgi:hypothetical protein